MREKLSQISAPKAAGDGQNVAAEIGSSENQIPKREKRAATRERLIEATIELLRSGGVGALNTVNITRQAKIAQSGFYLHFANIDECKRCAAERVAETIRDYIHRQRRELYKINSTDVAHVAGHLEKMLEIFRTERYFAEIFLHNRHDRSALGAVMRELKQQIETDLIDDLHKVLFRGKHLPDIERERLALQAGIILAGVLSAGEALIENRITEIKTIARLLAVNILSATDAVFAPL